MTREQLASLVQRHQTEIFWYVRYLGAAERTVVEDLVQETFLAAFRSQSFPPESDARRQSAWLRGIARHLFLTHCRKNRRSPVHFDSDTLERFEILWSTEYIREGDGADYVGALRECIENLAEDRRQVLDLRYGQGKSRAEMAQLCDMTEDGIKSLLRRMRMLLGECIRRRLALD